MMFLAPLALGILGLGVPLVLLYFLKARHRPLRVASTLWWERSPREREATRVLHRFRPDPLLWLQLLALVALALALAQPMLTLAGRGARRVVVVLDTSVSMRATDVRPSRMAAARDAALALVAGLGRGSEAMVIAAGIEPRVVVPLTRDLRRAADGIRSVEARDLPLRLAAAVRTAEALVGADPRAEIHVISDGAFDPATVADPGSRRLYWTAVGRDGDNVGITAFAVRPVTHTAGEHQAFVGLVNWGREARTFPLTVEVDGRTVSARTLTLGPATRRSVVVTFSHAGGGHARARIELDDGLLADNTAHAVLPEEPSLAVLLVSPGNLFLEKALRADPRVTLEVRTPERYPGGMEQADVVVLDTVMPRRAGPGRFVFVNGVPADVPVEVRGRAPRPVIVDWDRAHPVLRHVELAKLVVEEGLRLRPLGPGRPLVESVGGPLLWALEERDRRALVVGFDLFRSDLPLRIAFPLILSNALRWLHPASVDPSAYQVAAGDPIVLPLAHGVSDFTVTTPGGRVVKGQAFRGAAAFAETDELGVYTVRTSRGTTRIAVALPDGEESRLAPRPMPARPAAASDAAPAVPAPWELAGVLLAVAAAALALEGLLYWRRSFGGRWGRPRGGLAWALGVRLVLVGTLVACLARPTVPRLVDRMNVIFLLDASDSVSREAREQGWRFIAEALRSVRAADRASLVVFGERAAVDQGLEARTTFARPRASVGGRGTNLFEAIQLGLAVAPVGEANRLVLLTDGRQTAGSGLVAAHAARERGVDVHYVALAAPTGLEVIVERVILPQEVKFGEAFQTRVVVQSDRAADGRISLYRNGAFVGAERVRLAPGRNVFAYRQSLDSGGVHIYQAALDVPGDRIAENNRSIASVVVRGRPRVLVADKDVTHARALAAALGSQNLDVTVVPPGGIPADLKGLGAFDGLVLSNVSSLKLTQAQMENIRAYVRDQGGGLLMLGGEESFGLGGYYRTPVEEALPVSMEVRQRLEVPSLAVVLSIDRSGSMASTAGERITKLDLAREAAHLVVDLLDARHEVGVQSWDTEFIWDVPLGPAQDKPALHRAIASIKAGGGTDGYPALRDAHAALYERAALLKHVIFLSDGQMTRGDFAGLLRRMVKDRISVSTVAIGQDADTQLMVDVARWGRGRYYFTEDSQTIPRIFALETQLAARASIVEQPFRPRVGAAHHEAIQDIDWGEAPPLGGYVATTLKKGADLVLMSHQEDPVLATWRYGLGRTAAWTSDAKARWGTLWLRWPPFNKFWGQLVRWTLRTSVRTDTAVSLVLLDATGHLLVDASDQGGRFLNFLDVEAGVIAPDRARSVLDLEQIAPGRYRGRFAADQEGVYLVGMAPRRDGAALASQVGALVVPYAPELRELGPDEAALGELAGAAGGGPLAAPREVFERDRRRSRVPLDLWPWLAGAVALLLVPEVAVRRLGWTGVVGLLGRLRRPRGG